MNSWKFLIEGDGGIVDFVILRLDRGIQRFSKDNYYVFIYGWEDKYTKRYIALSSADFKYGISILIIDKKLEKAKKVQEKTHEDSEKHKALENF